jgi:hypothetical protein
MIACLYGGTSSNCLTVGGITDMETFYRFPYCQQCTITCPGKEQCEVSSTHPVYPPVPDYPPVPEIVDNSRAARRRDRYGEHDSWKKKY